MEQLVALCSKCRCCLAKTTHCWTCHKKKTIPELCDCGTCEEQAKDYQSRIENQRARSLARLVGK